MERIDGRRSLRLGGGEAGVSRIGPRDSPLAINRQPGVQRAVVTLGGVEVGLRELVSPALRRAAMSWARSRVRSVIRG